MTDRPESFRYGLSYGTVLNVHADAWEVDVAIATGGIVPRVQVIGSRLPEKNTPARPQWVVVGWIDALDSKPVCWPVESRLSGPREARAGFAVYDERDNYRFTLDHAGNYEIRNLNGGFVARLRIEEAGPKILLETPGAAVRINAADKSVSAICDGNITARAGGDVQVEAGGSATVEAAISATVKAPAITLQGNVSITGTLSVTGNITGAGTIVDAAGNTPNHVHP